MKKKVLLFAVASLSLVLGVTAGVVLSKADNGLFANAKDDSYWFHYAQVTPTLSKHGSKEFWANCSTHNFSLVNPGVGEDIREGVDFATTSYFEELTSEDPRYLPPLSERVDIKGYLDALLDAFNHDPYSYIPNTMRPEGVDKVSASEVNYDFESGFTNVSEIKYGGFGEQWHMVIENIKESERFYKITSYGSEVITAANAVARTFLDSYYDNVVTKTFNEASFTAKIDFHSNVLTYNIQFVSGINVPLFGEIIPQIDMEYAISSHMKTVRIQLGEGNAMKFIIAPDTFTFGLEYGITEVSRKAYFTISEDEYTGVEGHIYEYVQYKDKVLVPACADFYITEDYTTAVGNKASGLTGFTNYISELYRTDDGEMLGYEIQETLSKITYNTLWFNLNDITGINSVKHADDKFYVNNSADEFETKNYGGFSDKTLSRRYDIEERLQYFYGIVDEQLVEYETSIPMMFVQEEKLSDFSSDVNSKNSYLNVAINLLTAYLDKIQTDYDLYVPIFEVNKDSMPSASIVSFIGDAEII